MKSKKGVAWRYVVGLVIGLLLLLVLIGLAMKGRGGIFGIIDTLAQWFG